MHSRSLCLSSYGQWHCSAAPGFLSPDELAWLGDHRIITVGPNPDFPPIEFLDSAGTYKGMSADYLATIGEILGVRFKVVRARNRAELIAMVQQKKVDLLPAIVSSAARRQYLVFTAPWITVPGLVISARQCRSVKELSGKKVAVVDGSIWADYLSSQPVDVSLIRVKMSVQPCNSRPCPVSSAWSPIWPLAAK